MAKLKEQQMAEKDSEVAAVEIKWNDAHANSKDTFNLKKKSWHSQSKILQGEEDKLFKPDHFK